MPKLRFRHGWLKAFEIVLLSVLIGCASTESDLYIPNPSRGTMRMIETEQGVFLACLDFGGEGDPLVLLAGAGNSARIYEPFAPLFTDRFRVVAVTRRGYGESSKPTAGYDTTTLAEDLRNVLGAFGFEKAHILGHSMAGAEMTRFACLYPQRVLKLVYMDAAYDWAAQVELASSFPAPPVQPAPDEADLRSPAAYAAYWARMTGVPVYPVSDILATNRFSKDGRYRGGVTPVAIDAAVGTGLAAAHPDYAAVEAPMLAIYTAGDSVEQLFPWLTDDSDQREEAVAFQVAASAMIASIRDDFRRKAPDAQVVQIEGPHFIFLAQGETVAACARTFLLEPSP